MMNDTPVYIVLKIKREYNLSKLEQFHFTFCSYCNDKYVCTCLIKGIGEKYQIECRCLVTKFISVESIDHIFNFCVGTFWITVNFYIHVLVVSFKY